MRVLLLFLFTAQFAYPQSLAITGQMHHLRNTTAREWSTFPASSNPGLIVKFEIADATSWRTLVVRQKDVRQDWQILINGRDAGKLVNDEKDITAYLDIPPGVFVNGSNTLVVSTTSTLPDDIRVGEISLYTKSSKELLSACNLDISVSEGRSLIPSKITILNEKGSMVSLTRLSESLHLAVRHGCVYTATGNAKIGLPPGRYTVYATRGFEYSVDSVQVDLSTGEHKPVELSLSREVDTRGWISTDTHVHTFTHSGHGDATDRERIITLAGEGIEMPVITDHNKHVDLTSVVASVGVQRWMTVVTGNEVTTPVGHFNVFPVKPESKPVNHQVDNWSALHSRLGEYENAVIILNHANDIHNSFRPFDPKIHVSIAGMNVNDWVVPANSMEVLNSGSQQSDITALYRDWFGMLNGGHLLTPIGSSDSHDVIRFIVGQGRTYVKGNDSNPAALDIGEAVGNILEGKVMVSSGLLTNISVDKQFGPGDLARPGKKVNIDVAVLGPSWVNAGKVMLFVNGILRNEETISGKKVEKWKGSWSLDVPPYDVFVVAVALGPGSNMPFWPIEKPYQAQSPDWEPNVIGITGAVWIDGDRNGKRDTANDYAKIIIRSSKSVNEMISEVKKYDKAVAVQLAALLWKSGKDMSTPEVSEALDHAPAYIKDAFAEVNISVNR
jgi:hypothetical protein